MAREAPLVFSDLQMTAQALRDWVGQAVPVMIEKMAVTRREAPTLEGGLKGWVREHVTRTADGLRAEIPDAVTDGLRAGIRDEVAQAMRDWAGQTVPEMIERVAVTRREAPAAEGSIKGWVRDHVRKSLDEVRDEIPTALTDDMRAEVRAEVDRAVTLAEARLSEVVKSALGEVAERFQQTLEEIRNTWASMPAPQFNVPVPQVNVPVPQVNVNVPRQDAPQVNVTVPKLDVPTIEVTPPTLQVMPRRRVKKTITYDRDGRPAEIIEEEGE